MSPSADRIDFGASLEQAAEYRLEPADPGDVRGPDDAALDVPSEQQPRVAMPTSTFDCVRLDVLADHPAVDAVVRAEMTAGTPFRIVRFPFSLASPDAGRVVEARFTVNLSAVDGEAPRVHSVYPERLQVDGDEQTIEAAIEPKLSIGSVLDIGTGRIGRTIVARHPKSITVGFWSESGAEWVVRPPSDDEQLEGTWEFFVVVRWTRAVAPFRVALGASAVVTHNRGLMSWRTKRAERTYGPVELTGCVSIA